MHTNGSQTVGTHRSMEVEKNVMRAVIRNEYKRATDNEGEKNEH